MKKTLFNTNSRLFLIHSFVYILNKKFEKIININIVFSTGFNVFHAMFLCKYKPFFFRNNPLIAIVYFVPNKNNGNKSLFVII